MPPGPGITRLKPFDEVSRSEIEGLEAALLRFYSDPPEAYHAEAAAANEDWSGPGYELHRRIVAAAGKGARVLDIGCGPASAARYFTAAGSAYTGLDVPGKRLEENKAAYPSCGFIAADWKDLPGMGLQFEMAVSFFVLEHVARPREFLKAAASVLGKGGRLAVLCPDYLGRGSMPSLQYFGRGAGGLRAKLAGLALAEAAFAAVEKYVRYPRLLRRARAAAGSGGAWLINLRPVCLDAGEWRRDWDAVYMAGEEEVAGCIESLGFEVIETGRRVDGGRHGLCYVLAKRA